MNKTHHPITEYTLTNGNYSIRYTLIEEQISGEEGPRPSFSLTVKRGQELAVMEDFTHVKEKALPILELFCKQAVLPEELPDLAEDLLSDFEFVQ
ncbi:MAG: hypothetical protein IJY89_05580 [Clostridia bacterium]|nr:hypothetical protein [Clostridia bacterium]